MTTRTAIATTLLVFAPLLARANTELTVKSERTSFPVKGMQTLSGDKQPPANQTIHLTLGPRWIEWADGSNRGVYDFAKRVIFGVDPQTHHLVEESMYAAFSGRDAELENRTMLGGALEAGKVESNPMSPTLVEHQLSLRRDAKRVSGIEHKSSDGEERYLWQGQELFAYSTKLVPLAAPDRDLYIRYIRYSAGGHPEILADLQKLDGIPKWVRYSDPAIGAALRLEVLDSRKTPDADYVLPPLEKAPMKNPAAAAAAARVAVSTPESRAAFAARILAAANEAADMGRPLQAMLGYIEHQLMIGGEMPPDFNKRAEGITHDGNVRALAGAFQAASEAQARANIATLQGLAALAGDKAYVLGIFRANMESSLGNREAATSLFVAAITKNPFITGVWKDLGDSLDTGYDAVDTWRCYETARIIAPGHKLLDGIARGEAEMAREHPEYF
ncbi:MAG TPA: hypothetical protein VN380_15005 [Thermoanaerobaculia bacterium]|jgi:hypothetical protein|nr:hypothetical protein [Thermoanaerobaculia bacterium]